MMTMSNKTPQVIQDEVFTRQIAAACLDGPKLSHSDIARQLNISPALVRKIVLSPRFREIVEEAAEETLKPALARARWRMAKLADKALNVIEQNLDDGNLQAALAVLKGIGMDQTQEKTSDTHLTVVLPGAKTETAVDNSLTIEVPDNVEN